MPTSHQAGLAPFRVRLPNGAVVLAKESLATPAVTISATVAAGTVVDPPDAPGTAHFLSRVIDRGTRRRDAAAIADMLDGRGVALHAAATRHQLVLSCTCLSEDFPAMLGLVAEVLREPALSDHEIDTRRREIVTAIRQDQDSPAMVAIEEALALLYPGGHPYGRRMKGTIESVERIDRVALAACHARHVTPGSLVVTCVGDVEPERALDEAARTFGGWEGQPAEPAAAPSRPEPAARRQTVVAMPGKAQADVAYGVVALARGDPSFYAMAILANVLGQYAMGGRLGDSIRERQGMAYYVFSAFDASVGPAPLMVRAGVSPANVDRTIASIDEELSRMARDGVTPAELNASRTYLVTSMPRTLETNAGIAGFLQSCEHFGLGLDHDVRLPGRLHAVTLDQVNELARRFLDPGQAAIAVAGPTTESSPTTHSPNQHITQSTNHPMTPL